MEDMRLCLDRGADVDERDAQDQTALDIACRLDHVDAATLLIERGADLIFGGSIWLDAAKKDVPEGMRRRGDPTPRPRRGRRQV